MSSLKWFLLSFFGGGTAFWISDVVVNALDPNQQGYAVTVLCPMSLILFYVGMLRIRRKGQSGPSTAIFVICGVWTLAIFFMMLAQTNRGSGFRSAFEGAGDPGFIAYLLESSFIPTRVFLFAAMEGSVIALLLGTLAMLLCHIKFESTRWIIPPGLIAILRNGKR